MATWHTHLFRQLLVAFLVVFGLQACSRTKPARFYVLTPMPIAESVQPIRTASPAVTLGVGPIELPDYVDRPQIVTQDGTNTFQLAEFDRWAEPLEENFSRILIENLSDLLAPSQITVVPWTTALPLDYRIAVEVTRFYSDATGNTTLRAQWSIQSTRGADMLASRQSRIRESASGQDYAATVAAMSQTVAALSREIAETLKTVLQQRKRSSQKAAL